MTNQRNKAAFTAFRNNLAFYLEKIAKGETVEVINARRGRTITILKSIKKGGAGDGKT